MDHYEVAHSGEKICQRYIDICALEGKIFNLDRGQAAFHFGETLGVFD